MVVINNNNVLTITIFNRRVKFLWHLFVHSRHVETCVLLSHKTSDSHINVKVEFGEGEGKMPVGKIAEKAEEYRTSQRVTCFI